jgi:hypothetical protein
MHDLERLPAIVRALVRVVQAACNFAHDVCGNIRGEPLFTLAGAPHDLAEVGPLDVFHAEELPGVARVLKIVDLHDIRVVQAGR